MALMKQTPTKGHIKRSNTHQERDTASSRHSLATSHRNGGLREGKKHLFQTARGTGGATQHRIRRQIGNRTLPTYLAVAQQDEAVAETRRIANLVDGEKQGPAERGMSAQDAGNLPHLAQVQAFEGLVNQQDRLRRQ